MGAMVIIVAVVLMIGLGIFSGHINFWNFIEGLFGILLVTFAVVGVVSCGTVLFMVALSQMGQRNDELRQAAIDVQNALLPTILCTFMLVGFITVSGWMMSGRYPHLIW
jgi:hypothetical protein